MYGERSICTMAQNTPATATTVSTIEARAIALLLRGKICIEYEFFIYCGIGSGRSRWTHSYDLRHVLL
jgi:hypothetical protein